MKTARMSLVIVAVALSLFASQPVLCQEIAEGVRTESVKSKLPDINVATRSELQEIPGIGPNKAHSISEFIKENGRVNSIDELQDISGIGPKTAKRISEMYGTGN